MTLKLNNEEYAQFCNRIEHVTKIKSELRRGQQMYNALYHINPKVAESVGGTELDPFYHDDRIDKFLATIKP
jgi:hypothetical protein